MSLRWRIGGVALLLVLFGFITAANFVPKAQRIESPLLPDEGLRWGLDLQGGIHWVVGVDLDTALSREVHFVRNSLAEALENSSTSGVNLSVEGAKLVVEAPAASREAVRQKISEDFSVLERAGSAGDRMLYELVAPRKDDIVELTMRQVLEVLRRRIDDPINGIPDSVVTRQGNDRVLVQIPGGQIDRGRARELLDSTGFLEFKIVKDTAETEAQLLAKYDGSLPEGTGIATEVDGASNQVTAAYLVNAEADITGDYLEDARVGFDRQQRPIVEFQFGSEGGDLFGELSGANIGEQLAIVLDGRVYSAPVIRARISYRGQIEGRFTSQEAADLAVVLRAGSLSVPVTIMEERTVGPALGQDSIESGLRASVVGLLGIIAFAVGYYRLSGGYASFALLANLVLLIGLMSLFEATLTLPGIAGLVLTVGMAVDANVIIFERIREEMRGGKTTRAAIATGYNKALGAVLDANITTLITAIILFQFGTGPIKGFAVTLSVGIVTSVFSALVITRLLMNIYPGARPVALSI